MQYTKPDPVAPREKNQDEKHVSEAIQEFMKIISPTSANAGK